MSQADQKNKDADFEINQAALDYHANPRPGKISVEVSKSTRTQRDLALAYTPGVAEPVRRIAADPLDAYKYTAKGNLVAVITDGSAVLGLGNVGALAGKPVMEGKGVLFKHFAGIDVFDIEVNAKRPQEFIETVMRIAPTFGGINLEDIAAPHCFEIEQALIEQLDIPVFHDDQHGTAIIIAAALLNALELQGKQLDKARIVVLGAGAAGIAAVRLLIAMGAHRDNFLVLDRNGVIHLGRKDLNPYKFGVAVETEARTLADAMQGADVFIGVSGPDLVTEEMLAVMAEKPIVFALSNPVPEIRPEVARAVRDDLIMATGRSDYPNQVNNVLGFPFIFRGTLDVRASRINEDMQIAAVHALKDLTHQPVPQEVLDAYGLQSLAFGVDYILPKPLDARLKDVIPPAVARAAVESGVARAPWPAHYPAF
ncbi:MAG: malate dehydrogenase [Chromatiaceae bacterium]|nr:malate dehydrogenase [Gammaproteobacteria bacterium]MCP5317290.1 malate dehydrogenase [Chromatiaceae bacterium]MCP5436507.1 malate dehydrogenase [Chromatiaceae bacterium]HOP18335.1 malic enzyme-like NAD(P)-binding protein [Gammaproteobacteria bacterium]HPQ23294.1 malic enzyme-like NAD(P)-binding protein [Gammaproteobacteria bacterium]